MTLLWAFLATVVLDASAWPAPLHVLRTSRSSPPRWCESVAVVWVFVLLVVALIGRLWVALGVVTAITALLGVVNVTKLELRNDPLYPSDVRLPRPAELPVRDGLEDQAGRGRHRRWSRSSRWPRASGGW